jgi:hypothetical protein
MKHTFLEGLWTEESPHPGPGLRQWRNQRRALSRPRSYQSVQDGVLCEADPDGPSPGRIAEGVAEGCALPF